MAKELAGRAESRLAGIVVLDASALIALYSSADAHHSWALNMFRDTAASKLEMPVLSFAEVLVHPTRQGKREKFLSSISGLGLEVTELPAKAALELANLRNQTNLKMPDVVVLQRALEVGGTLATTDRKLAETASGLGLAVSSPLA